MHVTNRSKDLISGQEDLEFLFVLKNYPVFQGCTDDAHEQDIVHDLSFYISKNSGMVQTKELLPLDIVYQAAHAPGAVGQIWMEHHSAFAEFIHSMKPASVLEIGGSHGILSQCYEAFGMIDWTIIEPAPVDNPSLRAKLIKGFFDESTDIQADMVVHSHVLEHIYDPTSFFTALSRRPLNSKMCFSVPALEKHLEEKYTNALSFEHTYLCSEQYIEYWLAKSGYRIVNKQNFLDHSIFYATVRDSVDELPAPNLYNEHKQLMQSFIDYHQDNVSNLNKIISDSTDPVYLFGAHVFSQFLISMGLDTSKIVAVLDNSQAKQGHRLYGCKLMCQSPRELASLSSAIVILQAGQYTDEIRSGILSINTEIKFI
jgi:Methyltransferase domain